MLRRLLIATALGWVVLTAVGCRTALPPCAVDRHLEVRAPVAQRVAFIAVGDWGRPGYGGDQVAASLPRVIADGRYDLIITLGDNFVPGVHSRAPRHWQQYERRLGGLGLPVFAALGNHDYEGDVRAQCGYQSPLGNWRMAGRYYSFRAGPALFVALDTTRFDRRQRAWVARQLQSNAAPWVIVYAHHPLYSYGRHGNSVRLIRQLLPLLRGRAQLYIAGHDHDKQLIDRGHLPLYLIAGAAAKSRPTGRGPGTLYSSSRLGFLGVVLQGDEVRLIFYDQYGNVEYQQRWAPNRLGARSTSGDHLGDGAPTTRR